VRPTSIILFATQRSVNAHGNRAYEMAMRQEQRSAQLWREAGPGKQWKWRVARRTGRCCTPRSEATSALVAAQQGGVVGSPAAARETSGRHAECNAPSYCRLEPVFQSALSTRCPSVPPAAAPMSETEGAGGRARWQERGEQA